ncbi:SDR family NAD(P)-dependent oxidoreductase [Palleronia caenipelagi]|uniref:Glucose 1-dehydrogenase n=1 Tax=Palleronia caenipelagi TaxID=2489174 RepID=A0A547PMQ2_9RHOB|nr:glucose 1-dehydrogenase [Palleronia caenipelagi]TRD15437.1 glucose 1-dehydrogenase [Palleronia caenipelagi]
MVDTPKIALITGASRGIGAATARRFLDAGYVVFLGGRNLEELEDISAAYENAHSLILDVSDLSSIKAAFMEVRKQYRALDVLVNNAGVMHAGMIAMTKSDIIDDMFDTNVRGSYLCAQLATRLMSAKHSGSIINISSIMGVQGAVGYSGYSASKAAVIGMTKAMAKELAPSGVRVNALAPGFIETDLTASITGEARDKALASIRMNRFGTTDDVASAALFLASDEASYITGQVLQIDGSMTA